MIAGNFEDKYNTKNPVSKFLVKNFLKTFNGMLSRVDSPKKIVELGTGEGQLIKITQRKFPKSSIWGSDISKEIIKIAARNLKGKNISLSAQDIHKLSYKSKSFDLVICCEVLEHVDNPKKALREIKRISKGKVLLSVPLEPLWRILNMSRGKYLTGFGNTPGHINHFAPGKFKRLVEDSGFKILLIKYPMPWQMVLIESK